MRRHFRDNGDIDVGCRVRQIEDYMFARRLDMSATVDSRKEVAKWLQRLTASTAAEMTYVSDVGHFRRR